MYFSMEFHGNRMQIHGQIPDRPIPVDPNSVTEMAGPNSMKGE